MKRILLLALLAASGVRAQEAAARAETPPATSDLEGLLDQPVISGASSDQETASDAPATTTVITAEQIQHFGLRSIDEAITFFALGMNVQDPLQGKEIGARGVLLSGDFSNHVLLVVDGHIMNEPYNGSGYLDQRAGIPMGAIDHIEVILGPGSVLYGGNSMLGTVNVVTRKPADQPGLVLGAGGGLSPQQGHAGKIESFTSPGGTYRVGAGWAGTFGLFGQKASLLVHAQLAGESGPSFLFGPQAPNNGAPRNYGPLSMSPGVWGGRAANAERVPSLYARLELGDFAFAVHASSAWRTPLYQTATSFALLDFNDQHSYDREVSVSLDASWRKQVTQKLGLVARLFADSYDRDDLSVGSDPLACPGGLTCAAGLPSHQRWAGAELRGTYDWTSRGTLTTLVGAEARLRRIRDSFVFIDFTSGHDLASASHPLHLEQLAAVYLQQRASPLQFLHLNAGLRLDADSRTATTALSPRVAATVDLWKGGTAKAIYSTGYRTPAIFENEFAAAPLKPEQVRSYEASVEQRWGRTRILVGAFRTDWDNLVQRGSLAGGFASYQNAGRIENYGGELSASMGAGRVSLGGTFTLAHSRQLEDASDDPVAVAPQLFGNAYALLDLGGGHALAFAASLSGDRIADRGVDGFAVTPIAKAAAQLRLMLSGPLGGGLEYRLGADYNTGSSAPYVVGPVQEAGADPNATAELAPTVRFTAFAGLRLRFAP